MKRARATTGETLHVAVALLAALHLYGCGGRSPLSPTEVKPKRSVSVSDHRGLRIITLDDPAFPILHSLQGHPSSSGYSIPTRWPKWNVRGTALLYTAENASGDYPALTAWAPTFSPPRLVGQARSPGDSNVSICDWLGDFVFEFGAEEWVVRDASALETWRETRRFDEGARIWRDSKRRSAVFPTLAGHVWIKESGEVVPLKGTIHAVFGFAADRLIMTYRDEGPMIGRPDIWPVRVERAAECMTESPSEDDCFPEQILVTEIGRGDRVVVQYRIRDTDFSGTAYVTARWGEELTLTWPPQQRSAIWSTSSSIEKRTTVQGSTLWTVRPQDGDQILRSLDVARDGAEPREVARFPQRGFVDLSPVVAGLWFSPRSSGEDSPHTWDVMDLRDGQPRQFEPTPFVGELALELGNAGLIFLDADNDPPYISCDPCSYTAVEDVTAPDSRTIRGTVSGIFVHGGPHSQALLPAPDGSGVLVVDQGTLFFHSFNSPDTRFPLTKFDENSFMTVPPTWGN